MSWTDERVNALKKLWAEGYSASQIAKQLGDVTRNAVIGKVHRLGLSGRATPSRLVKRSVHSAPSKTPVSHTPEHSSPISPAKSESKVELTPKILPNGEAATILTLKDSMCKWPIGDPSDENFSFCGRASVDGGPYCAEHAKIAFQTNSRKEKKRVANA